MRGQEVVEALEVEATQQAELGAQGIHQQLLPLKAIMGALPVVQPPQVVAVVVEQGV